jgi:hypothetical protein
VSAGMWERDGATVYVLTTEGVNAWWAAVQSTGRVARGEASPAECARIATLMQAAPEMLTQLREILIDAEEGRGPLALEQIARRARLAIAKAEGREVSPCP